MCCCAVRCGVVWCCMCQREEGREGERETREGDERERDERGRRERERDERESARVRESVPV